MTARDIFLRYGQVIDGVTLVPKPVVGFENISGTAVFFRRGDVSLVQSRSQAAFLAGHKIEGVWDPGAHKNCQYCGGNGHVQVEGSDFDRACPFCYNGVPNVILAGYRITVTE